MQGCQKLLQQAASFPSALQSLVERPHTGILHKRRLCKILVLKHPQGRLRIPAGQIGKIPGCLKAPQLLVRASRPDMQRIRNLPLASIGYQVKRSLDFVPVLRIAGIHLIDNTAAQASKGGCHHLHPLVI